MIALFKVVQKWFWWVTRAQRPVATSEKLIAVLQVRGRYVWHRVVCPGNVPRGSAAALMCCASCPASRDHRSMTTNIESRVDTCY
jgi:hypothetical protein